MNALLIDRIETNVERAASAAFAGAVGYAIYGWLSDGPLQPELGFGLVVAAAIAYFLCRNSLLTLAARERRFPVSIFDVREIEAMDTEELLLSDRVDPSELVLTEADRVHADELVLTEADRLSDQENPLVLDDILAEIGADSRVVRLFDRKAMPTPGQLKSRIDSHVEQRSPSSSTEDAAQALSDALAELRRSLR